MNVFDRILVTGGRGMLAHAFRMKFAGGPLNVTFADRTTCDVCDEGSLTKAFNDLQPTLVLNCAAYTKVDLAEKEDNSANQCNGYGVGHLAELCRDYGAMLVHFSTDYVFDGSVTRPLQPGDPLGPLSAYGKSKLFGERLLQETPPARWLILRTAWLYGPGGPCFPATMINAAKAGKPLKVIDDQHGSPTFTYDLVEATLNLVHLGANGVWHLTNGGQTTWYDFTAAILEEFGLSTPLSRTTSAAWKKLKPDSAHRPGYSVLDVTPYEAFTHLPMPGWRDALHRYRVALETFRASLISFVQEHTVECQLCGRTVPRRLITLHHLKPKSRGGTAEHRVPLCKPCHKQVHATFDNRTLDESLADLPALRQHPAMEAFMKWIVKQSPHRNFKVTISNAHPHAKRRR